MEFIPVNLTAGSSGSLKEDVRTNTGTRAPLSAAARNVDATPSCVRPVGVSPRTTATVAVTTPGLALGDDEME